MVTTENYEEYMMLDADGELDSTGKAALQAFIAANPALQEEYAAWQTLKLRPEATLTYPDKEALRKMEPKGRIIGFRPFALAAAAAVLAALFLVPALWKQAQEQPVIAHAFSEPEPAVPVRDYYADSVSQNSLSAERKKPGRPAKPGSATGRNRLAKQIPAQRLAIQTLQQDSMISLNGAIAGQLSEKGLAAPLLETSARESLVAVRPELPVAESQRQPLITLAPENRQAFQLLKDAFEARLAQASSAARAVKETALEIRLGHGAINLSF